MNQDVAVPDIRIGTIINTRMKAASTIEQILPHGFESFALFFWQHTRQIEWERLADEIHRVLDGTGAAISAIGAYGNPLEAGEINRETVKGIEECIENAHLFNCREVTAITGRVRGCPVPASMDRLKEVWSPLLEGAGAKDVRICFEGWDGEGTWLDGDLSVMHHPAAWEMVFEALPYENVGLELDPGCCVIRLIDPIALIPEWGHKVFHVHGKDATVRWDVVRRHGTSSFVSLRDARKAKVKTPPLFGFFRTPGFGDTDWRTLISELRLAGYTGAIDIEGGNDPVFNGALEMTGQVESLRYLKECRGEVCVPNPA
ncbi:MAG: sugar phosphate isomerase/epimerase [Kiritimatiellae bacterium]|nr:sugar phosphate isomerase/epimerase [Kiritimatiellia bacterium]